MEITEISIKNIKGFGEPTQNIKLDNSIKFGKVNLLVAPNGWGKSSLTAAFEGLKKTILDIPKDNKPFKDDTLDSSISLAIDNEVYTADSEKNEIDNIISCDVIHCDTYPVVETRKIRDFSSSKGYIGVKAIQVCKVPKKYNLVYSITKERNSFGANKKVLKNLDELLKSENFLELFSDDAFLALERISSSKTFVRLFDAAKTIVNKINESEEKLKKIDFTEAFEPLLKNQHYSFLKETFGHNLSDLEFFALFYQLLSLFKNNKKSGITNYLKNIRYKKLKEELNKNIEQINTTWKTIKCTEHDGYLFVEFPNADLISNGQRDILTFTVHLQVYKSKLKAGKKYLLLIDEVFDYLDDANILAVQYYLTDLLRYSDNIDLCLCLFTHLDPKYFRTYTFNQKIINVCYLKDVQAKSSEFMKTFIAFRQSIGPKKKDANIDLYNKLSKYCFHYHLDLPNFKADIIPYHRSNLKENWCEGDSLFIYLTGELNKYLADSHEYDPYAVSLAIRIGTEKKVYEQLSNDEDKNLFMNVHCNGTKDKIEFAEEKNLIIPDAYYILCLIHGESDHIEYDENHKKFNEKPVIYKLNNPVVKHMVAKLFDFEEGTEVPLSKIH